MSDNENIVPDLSAFDDVYEATEPPERKEIPDGSYQVKVERVEVKTAKTSGDPMLSWQMVVIAGPHAGAKLFKNSSFGKNSIEYTKADLKTAGFLGRPSELGTDEGRAKLLDVCLHVTKKTKIDDKTGKDNINVYFNKRMNIDPKTLPSVPSGSGGAGSGAGATPPGADTYSHAAETANVPF